MAFKPGCKKPPGSGRKKGQISRDRQMLLDKAAELGCDPFEVNLMIAAGDWKNLGVKKKDLSLALRQRAATDACQFMLPRLKAIEIEDKSEFKPLITYIAEWGSQQEAGDDDSKPDEEA